MGLFLKSEVYSTLAMVANVVGLGATVLVRCHALGSGVEFERAYLAMTLKERLVAAAPPISSPTKQ